MTDPERVVTPSERHTQEVRRGSPVVAVVGLGYVGLPTSLALLAQRVGVIGIDSSRSRIEAIRAKTVDLISRDRELLDAALENPDFLMTTDAAAMSRADAVIVCVPTPVDAHLNPDLRALESACRTVVSHAVPGQTIILTSTSYVGCTRDLVVTPLEALGRIVGRDIHVAYSPERIDPGTTDFTQSVVPRVVGGVTAACRRKAADIIGRIAPVHPVSSPEAAELTKLYENTFRAVNIALANEFESVTDLLGLDVREVFDAAATKPFGFMPFSPGTGVGGHCIPCDPHYLLWQLRAQRAPSPLIEQAMTDIGARPREIVQRATEMLSRRGIGIRGARILVVGVAYKPGVEDVRESPALAILVDLRERGASTDYLDPLVPSVRLSDGTVILSVKEPTIASYDLVIVHALQPGTDRLSIRQAHLLLDPGGQVTVARPLPQEIDFGSVAVNLGTSEVDLPKETAPVVPTMSQSEGVTEWRAEMQTTGRRRP